MTDLLKTVWLGSLGIAGKSYWDGVAWACNRVVVGVQRIAVIDSVEVGGGDEEARHGGLPAVGCKTSQALISVSPYLIYGGVAHLPGRPFNSTTAWVPVSARQRER